MDGKEGASFPASNRETGDRTSPRSEFERSTSAPLLDVLALEELRLALREGVEYMRDVADEVEREWAVVERDPDAWPEYDGH